MQTQRYGNERTFIHRTQFSFNFCILCEEEIECIANNFFLVDVQFESPFENKEYWIKIQPYNVLPLKRAFLVVLNSHFVLSIAHAALPSSINLKRIGCSKVGNGPK